MQYDPPGAAPAATYRCACCGAPLFAGESKFDSTTGWPSFTAPFGPKAIGYARDSLLTSVEVHCGRCGAHLGHVFTDGPKPLGLRYCIDGVCLRKAAFAGGTLFLGDPPVLPGLAAQAIALVLLVSAGGACWSSSSLGDCARCWRAPRRAALAVGARKRRRTLQT